MPQIGVDVPDEVMVALSEHRISLLLDHQADQLIRSGQAATAIIMSTVLSVSGELMLASAAIRNDTRELDSRGSPRAQRHESRRCATLVDRLMRGCCFCAVNLYDVSLEIFFSVFFAVELILKKVRETWSGAT